LSRTPSEIEAHFELGSNEPFPQGGGSQPLVV